MGCGASQRVEAQQPQRSTSSSRRREAGARAAEQSRARNVLVVRPTTVRENFNAFCFQCGIFCNLDRDAPECPECGGDFVQFLRQSNWISANDPGAEGFAFDDQLERSISVSLAETPVPKKPTKRSFLETLQPVKLDQNEVDARSRSRQTDCSDPKSNCSWASFNFVQLLKMLSFRMKKQFWFLNVILL